MNDQLLHQLRLLKLPGVREHFEARVMEAEANNLSHTEFLSMLMTDELDLRTTRRVDRLIRLASLGAETTIETFDWSFNPSINAKLIKGLATCRFIERSEGVILLGPTSTGKAQPIQSDTNEDQAAACV